MYSINDLETSQKDALLLWIFNMGKDKGTEDFIILKNNNYSEKTMSADRAKYCNMDG